jgi:hypothetical protein
MLNAFLNYLEEHPATRTLAEDFADVLTHLGCLNVNEAPAREEAMA